MLGKVRVFLEMIKFSHTIFALPFALSSAFIAAGGMPSPRQFFWIMAAMIGARTGAMAFNRLADTTIDAGNPRTRERALPRGLIGRAEVAAYTAFSFGLLIFAAFQLNMLCFYLSFPLVALLMFYSYTKRFTSLAHIVLGICLGSAPLGAWIAIRGSFGLLPLILCCAVLFWVAGFDILYALQDMEFDRQHGLFSIPSRFGVKGSILLARVFHAVMISLLIAAVVADGLGIVYIAGIAVIAGMLLYEHRLVKPGDLTKLDVAFFNMNGYISVVFFLFVVADIYWRKS